MISYKHTKEELRNFVEKTNEYKSLEKIAINYNDKLLKIYVNLLKSEIQLELNRYNYLIGINVLSLFEEGGKIVNIHSFYRDSVLVSIRTEDSSHLQLRLIENLTLID